MQGSKKFIIGALVLALAGSGAAIATAQSTEHGFGGAKITRADYRGDHGDRDHRGGHKQRGHGGEMIRALFAEVDADGDKILTREEIDTYRAARIAEVDASGDGALSIEEFDTLYRDLTRSRMVDAFQKLDDDGNGVISAAEMDQRVAHLVERLDRDGDGQLKLQRPMPEADDD